MSRSIPQRPAGPQETFPPPARRGAGLVGTVALLLFVFLAGSAAMAQEDDNATYWLHERARQDANRVPQVVQRPTHLIRRAAPVKGFAREVPPDATLPAAAPGDTAPATAAVPAPDNGSAPAANAVAPAANAPAPASAGAPAAKPAPGTFVVAVMGDSLGALLAQGLTEAFADKPEVMILRKARENSGLVRDDYYDWVKAAHDLLSGPDKIDAAVMMVGSNDRQQIRDGTGTADLHSPRWTQLYEARVETIATLFRDKKIPLIWVGLPIMKSERLSADMLVFNEIYRDTAGKAGATYVDTWEAFSDDRGQFTAYGPDVSGQFVKIRSSDGVHFTPAGARTLAHFVEDELRHDEEQARPPVDPTVAALQPATPAPSQSNKVPGATAAFGGLTGVPVPAPPPAVIIPVKPAAGPVVPLNAPAVATDGQLASLTRASTGVGDPQSLLDRALTEGHPLDPRPGRTDDFTWPRR